MELFHASKREDYMYYGDAPNRNQLDLKDRDAWNKNHKYWQRFKEDRVCCCLADQLEKLVLALVLKP
jgi:hypothetical protein